MSSVLPQRGARPQASGGAASSAAWSDDQVDRLKALWADETLSAAAIARRLGVSRNAVLGKVHRLVLSNRREAAAARPARTPRLPSAARPAKRARPAPGPQAPRLPRTPTPPMPVVDVGPGLVSRLENLPPHGCHWPMGDPAAAEFRFCGRHAVRAPYCEGHRRAAYKPGGPRPVAALLKR
jgi:GcrA cell cycle regulator